jgi:hypothetical protein
VNKLASLLFAVTCAFAQTAPPVPVLAPPPPNTYFLPMQLCSFAGTVSWCGMKGFSLDFTIPGVVQLSTNAASAGKQGVPGPPGPQGAPGEPGSGTLALNITVNAPQILTSEQDGLNAASDGSYPFAGFTSTTTVLQVFVAGVKQPPTTYTVAGLRVVPNAGVVWTGVVDILVSGY